MSILYLVENHVHPLYGVDSNLSITSIISTPSTLIAPALHRDITTNQLDWRLELNIKSGIPLLHSSRNIAVFVYCMQLTLNQKEGLFIMSTGENIDLPFIYILIYYSGNILSKTRLPGNEYFHIKNFASQVIGFHNRHH